MEILIWGFDNLSRRLRTARRRPRWTGRHSLAMATPLTVIDTHIHLNKCYSGGLPNQWVQEWTLFAGPPGPGGEEMFVWKVKITLPNNAGESEYLPRRLLSSKYEAQHDAAHHVLKELGIA